MRRLTLIAGLVFLLAGAGFYLGADEESVTNSLGIKLIRVEPGRFQMGSALDRDYWTEQPVHEVNISKPFYISEEEVTLEQFRQFRPEFTGNNKFQPFAAGVSWHDAQDFCKWLSEKEGKPYRLPTEAEWEYVARAGWQPGMKPAPGQSNPLGVKNMLTGVREWCHDWFGEYPADPQSDPVGPAFGFVKVVRGGALDREERNALKKDFYRPQSRLAVGPAFGVYSLKEQAASGQAEQARAGLVGVWYDNIDLTEPRGQISLERIDNSWSNDPRGGGNWSAVWRGQIEAPYTGQVEFSAETDNGMRLKIGDKTVIDGWGRDQARSGSLSMKKGEKYPIEVSFFRQSGAGIVRLFWSWPGQDREIVPAAALSHTEADEEAARSEATAEIIPGEHAIGFRIVQAPLPSTPPLPYEPPLVQQFVKQLSPEVKQAPDPSKPYYRKRYLLPTPLENSPNEAIDAAGLHPSFRRHNHSPGLEVLPNGDVLMVIYTSYHEYEPGVSVIASRLRFGAEQWDMPSTLVDEVGVNDHAPLLWSDNGAVHMFWGHPQMEYGAFPFQWFSTQDSGATWSEIKFPRFFGKIGDHTKQPINTAFRDRQGTMYVSSDGSGGRSLLWASKDNGQTWFDTGGRSAGRHTSFVLLKDGGILGMGGKNTDIDGYMPQAISKDGGITWEVSKTVFPQQGSNQRPSIIRLQSGRLLFVGDFVLLNDGSQPRGVNQLGSYVALSEDEGKTWHIKKLVGAQLHENHARAERMRGPTLGYAAARQGPNGLIHVIATMNNPCLHFEINEAWILDQGLGERPDPELMVSAATRIADVRKYEEKYSNGRMKATWSGGTADDGRFLLDGTETWYYEDGKKKYEVSYRLGQKVGQESFWSPEGQLRWSWQHEGTEKSRLTEFRPNSLKKSESNWQNFHAHGQARLWDRSGKLTSDRSFSRGRLEDQ